MAESNTNNNNNAAFVTCEIKLDTRSSGWHKTMIKILNSIRGVSYSIDAEAGMAYVAGTVDPNILLTSFAKAGKHAQLLRVHSDSGHHRHHFSTSVGNSSTGNVNRSVKPPPQDNQYRLGDGGSGYGYGTKSNQYRLVDGSSGYGYVSKSNQYEQDRRLVTKTHHYHRPPPLAPPVGGDSDQCSIM